MPLKYAYEGFIADKSALVQLWLSAIWHQAITWYNG